MSEPQRHAPSGALRLPRDTTPTWEIELLISGATVFGLMQLPPKVEAGLIQLVNRSAQDIASLLVPVWIYVQAALVILIGTFIVHLCLRAYWVALVGLTSVYPGGVNWASFKKAGPYQLESSRRGREDMPALIEAADNRASRLFGVGVGLAMAIALPMVLVTLTIVLALLLRLLPEGFHLPPMTGFTLLFVLIFVPWVIAMLLDRKYAARWTPQTRAGRFLRGLFTVYARVGFARASNLPLALYTSNSEGHRGNFLMVLLSMTIMFGVSLQIISRIADWSLDDIDGLPDFSSSADSPDILLPRFYASMAAREPTMRPMPYIPDPLVRGPYLRLFVPYRVDRHNLALARLCDAATAEQRATRVALDCFARLHDVRIDGVPVENLHFDAAEDPVNALRGMLAMIPVSTLAPGRHELSVLPMPRERDYVIAADGSASAKTPVEPYVIPFWR